MGNDRNDNVGNGGQPYCFTSGIKGGFGDCDGRTCVYCCTSVEASNYSRRCFITGEYCSKQLNIQRERKKLHDQKSIAAFVIMNFSDMSNVVYKWRIKPFIEKTRQYLFFGGLDSEKYLYCSATSDDERNPGIQVESVKVVRSDSDPSSNYVICSRICQQIQIADLIVVDVSNQNANVMYEFGMAVAFGKMILPICYSESFYRIVYPDKIKGQVELIKDVEHHIGCYPWRKMLFEHYGLYYKYSGKGKTWETRYEDFDKIVNPRYGFTDMKYDMFPYHETVSEYKDKIGKVVYDKLKDQYNEAKPSENTLVVYTLDSFLNEEQAGHCIVNFYHRITARMQMEKIFRGERVGVLVQTNKIEETEKDSRNDLSYGVGEIIQIGVNEATYKAKEREIKSNDDYSHLLLRKQSELPESIGGASRNHINVINKFILRHISNRGLHIYPDEPVYVDRMKNLLYKDILESVDGEAGCFDGRFFCLYHDAVTDHFFTVHADRTGIHGAEGDVLFFKSLHPFEVQVDEHGDALFPAEKISGEVVVDGAQEQPADLIFRPSWT